MCDHTKHHLIDLLVTMVIQVHLVLVLLTFQSQMDQDLLHTLDLDLQSLEEQHYLSRIKF
jgi:hypothetical protein